MNKIKELTDFYMWMKENDHDHNIRARVEKKAEMYLNGINVEQKLPIHKVSVCDLIVGDIVYTQDGRRWVINEINGNDLLVDGNGRRNYPLEKCDVSHTFYDIKENSQDLDTDIVDMVNEEFWNLI